MLQLEKVSWMLECLPFFHFNKIVSVCFQPKEGIGMGRSGMATSSGILVGNALYTEEKTLLKQSMVCWPSNGAPDSKSNCNSPICNSPICARRTCIEQCSQHDQMAGTVKYSQAAQHHKARECSHHQALNTGARSTSCVVPTCSVQLKKWSRMHSMYLSLLSTVTGSPRAASASAAINHTALRPHQMHSTQEKHTIL